MVIKKIVKILILLQILLLVSCEYFIFTQPYNLNGNVTVFYDGLVVGTFYEERIDGSSASEGDINFSFGYGDESNPEMVDDFLVYHRKLTVDEIYSIYKTNGNLPDNKSYIAGYYQFEGNLVNNSIGIGADGVASDLTASYISGGLTGLGLNITKGEKGNILFDSTILPNVIEDMTVNIWVKASSMHEGDFISILNCWGGDDHDDFFNIDYSKDTLRLTDHNLASYDADEWHMITYVIE